MEKSPLQATEFCGKILVVDDDVYNRRVLQGMLEKLGHHPVMAENAMTALRLLDRSFDLVLADVMMPKINGFEMVRMIRNNPATRDIPVIMVTTLSDKAERLQAVEVGANDFIAKPVDMMELKIRSASMLKQKAQQDELYTYQTSLEKMVEARTVELRQALINLDNSHVETIQHLSAAAEYKDDDTAMHLRRMSNYAALIAEKLGLEKSVIHCIRISSPMHDIGKIGIPDHILLKPGKLSDTEWQTMKTHTEIGGMILKSATSTYMVMGTEIALSHHEKWDGSGYPSGLAGEAIPLTGRIAAVADVFDALTSRRPYKEAFSIEKSIKIMQEGRGSHFDPRILDVFLQQLETVVKIRQAYQDKPY
ncbi:MAG: response regulator [Deltaproteobacteria bacterium]|nr:response regulator [Deltaproteobacteria bacterium]